LPVKEIKLTDTEIPKELFESYISEIASRFTQETYHLLENNCNHFTNDICNFLTGTSIPDWILKQHEEIFSTPMGKMFMPMIQNMSSNNNQFLPQMFEGDQNTQNKK
jgi:hypothetical protein